MVERLLDRVPWAAIAAAAAITGLLVVGGIANGWRKDGQLARQEAKRERKRADDQAAKVRELEDARTEDARRVRKQTEIANEATKQLAGARADASAADLVADRLRARLAAIVAERRADDSAAAGGSAPAGDPIGMLADVLGRCERRTRVLAEYADAAGVAGRACEHAYDALSAPAGTR